MLVQVARYSLVIPMIEDRIEYETVTKSLHLVSHMSSLGQIVVMWLLLIFFSSSESMKFIGLL